MQTLWKYRLYLAMVVVIILFLVFSVRLFWRIAAVVLCLYFAWLFQALKNATSYPDEDEEM